MVYIREAEVIRFAGRNRLEEPKIVVKRYGVTSQNAAHSAALCARRITPPDGHAPADREARRAPSSADTGHAPAGGGSVASQRVELWPIASPCGAQVLECGGRQPMRATLARATSARPAAGRATLADLELFQVSTKARPPPSSSRPPPPTPGFPVRRRGGTPRHRETRFSAKQALR